MGTGATREEAHRCLFDGIGAFLAQHRLEPSPTNYGVAHAFVTASDDRIVQAVTHATFGGLRLSQTAVDAIVLCAHGGSAFAPSVVPAPAMRPETSDAPGIAAAASGAAELVRAIDEAREKFDRYAGIVDSSRQDAQAYGDALVSNAATMTPIAAPETGGDAVAALLALTESMIAKTRRAEEQLRAASAEMDDLRANLAVARQDADTDPLTGLPNRRAFEACFAGPVGESRPGTVSLALCDIDLFKGINDRYGHDVGDRVIRLVAKELAQGCDGSVVARYGGEEFVILFEGCDPDLAMERLDRTRAELSRRSFRVAGTAERLENLSFSGGVIAVAPQEDCRTAMKRADAALYRAKQNGRNRIERGD